MMTKHKLIILISMGILSSLFGCKNGHGQKTSSSSDGDTTKSQFEEITAHIDPEEGWSDIFLKILSTTPTDSSHIYIAKGLYKGKLVGLKMEVKKSMAAGIIEGGQINKEGSFIRNGMRLSTIGQESDELVKALSELYEVPTTKPFAKTAITTTAFSMNQKTADLDSKDYYKFKLFFEENSEELYSELYFNIDLIKQIVELNEKDEGYRENIIKVWTK